MEARIKRLFNRNKGISSDQTLQRSRGSAKAVESAPNLSTSLYDSVLSASPPQSESYQGDSNPSRQNRKSSLSHHEREESLSENVDHGMIEAPVWPKSRHNKLKISQTIQPDSSQDKIESTRRQQTLLATTQLNDFSNLSLGDKDCGYVNKNIFSAETNCQKLPGAFHRTLLAIVRPGLRAHRMKQLLSSSTSVQREPTCGHSRHNPSLLRT